MYDFRAPKSVQSGSQLRTDLTEQGKTFIVVGIIGITGIVIRISFAGI